MSPRPVPGETLGDLGPIRISDRAGREFCAALPRLGWPPMELEAARARLAEILADARQSRAPASTGAAQWRHRSGATKLDIEAHVDERTDHVVVTHIHVRALRRGGRR